MTPLDDELKQALRRQEPSADFTARVLARCAEADAQKRAWLSWPNWRLGLATTAAAALLTLGGGTLYQQHEHEVKGMAAKRQLLLAMRIAGSKLQQVQERVNESEQQVTQ
jgi:anti-sigma-K factor RskA